MTDLIGLSPMSVGDIALRLSCALFASLAVGLERETQDKSAGLRTNLLVGLASALVVIVPIQVGAVVQSVDVLGRALQGVMTGAGFVGADTVFGKNRPRGLTSAAAVWVSAALSVAAACGQWQLCLAGALVAWVILRVLDRLEEHLP